jgi:hypothetical protein
VCFIPIPDGLQTNYLISQESINFLTNCVLSNLLAIYTPDKLKAKQGLDFDQVTMPIVHPTKGKTICSQTSKIWQTAFGKDLGGMVQGNNKTGQKGTNAIIIMTNAEIPRIPKNQTNARVLVDFCPQKSDLHRIRITASGNLINYPGNLLTRTANLTTSKIMWNSVLSTKEAKYMCLDIKNFYLSAPMDRFEYMKFISRHSLL